MSTTEIIKALSKLSPRDLKKVRAKIDELSGEEWIDGDDPLTDAQKRMIEKRIADHERDPKSAIPWEEFDQRLKRRLGK
ncbi:MAG: addiction module protein [Planctomycetes bacterium]|nr:addiction module protein [Planctomycetota bacterium]